MKTRMMMLAMMFCCAMIAVAKDVQTVVLNTSPEMHCSNCEDKIKNNIRFEKGVKEIITNLEDKTVTIKYDAEKTTVDKIIAAFGKIGYTASVAGEKKAGSSCCGGAKKEGASCCGGEKKESSSCCGSGSCACSAKKEGASCCGGAKKEGASCCGGAKKDSVSCCGGAKKEGASCCGGAKKQASSCCGSAGCKCSTGTPCGSSCGSSAAVEGATVSFKAEQMACGGCAAKVKKLLTEVEGVKTVDVTLDDKTVKVVYDAEKVTVDQLKDAFGKINYTVTVL